MRVTRIGGIKANPTFKGLRINANENKKVKFLYNKVLDIVKENKIPATFSTDSIELPRITDKIVSKLKELEIVFKGETK